MKKKTKNKVNKKSRVKKIAHVDKTKIEDEDGNVEKYDKNTNKILCDFNAGDYQFDNLVCKSCESQLLCIVNAVVFGRIERETLPPDVKPQIDNILRNEQKFKEKIEQEQMVVVPDEHIKITKIIPIKRKKKSHVDE